MTIFAAITDVLAQSSDDSIIDEALTVSDWIQAGIIVAATIVVAVIAARLVRRVLIHVVGRASRPSLPPGWWAISSS